MRDRFSYIRYVFFEIPCRRIYTQAHTKKNKITHAHNQIENNNKNY